MASPSDVDDFLSPGASLAPAAEDLKAFGFTTLTLSVHAAAALLVEWRAYASDDPEESRASVERTAEGRVVTHEKGGAFLLLNALARAVLRALDRATTPGALLSVAERQPYTRQSHSELLVNRMPVRP